MIEELIKKYEEKVKHYDLAYRGFIDSDLDYKAKECLIEEEKNKEILEDIKNIKKHIKDLIPFLPAEEKHRTFDDKKYTEYRICDSDFEELIGKE
jgi:peptide methionine sulfoxide reductase MsrA